MRGTLHVGIKMVLEFMWNDILINFLEDGLFAAIAAIGFSSISNTPHRAYLTCAVIAAAGHSIRYALT